MSPRTFRFPSPRALAPGWWREGLAVLAVACGLAAAAMAVACAPALAAAPPPGFMGTQGWDRPTDADFRKLGAPKMTGGAGANLRVWRQNLNWAAIEPTKPVGDCTRSCRHTYDWRSFDKVFRTAAQRGVRILPVLIGSPKWANAVKPQYPPSSASAKRAFAHFASAAAARYGPAGSLWTEAPWSTAHPAPRTARALHWQVWNEPNLPNYWNGADSPRASEYAAMLKGVSYALKRTASETKVVAAGLPWGRRGKQAPAYLADLLRAPGVTAAADVFAAHPYARHVESADGTGVIDRVRTVRRVMDGGGAAGRSLWLTEVGWATGRDDGRFMVSERKQTENLDNLYRRLLELRTSHRLLGAVTFSYRDEPPPTGTRDWWALHTGLLRRDGGPKLAWTRLRARALGGW